MTCEAIRSLFSDHVDRLLPPDQEERLGVHLAACAACRAALVRFQAPLQALRGAAPALPPSLSSRMLAAAKREGLLARRGWLLPLVASLAVFAAGYLLGRRAPLPAAPAPRFAAVPASCGPDLVPALDQAALRGSRPAAAGRELQMGPGRSVRVPANLLSHGPYAMLSARTLAAQGGACVPLTSAWGDVLALVVVPAPARASAGSFVVETDPRRVLYGRVRWVEDGVEFSLEGRAEGRELLELAQEIAGATRIGPTAG